MKKYLLALCFVFSASSTAEVTSVTVTKTYSMDRASRGDVLTIFKHHALAKAGKQLPILLSGSESVNNGQYSEELKSYSASILQYELTHESINKEENTIELTGRVTFDSEEALRTLQRIKDGIDSQRKSEAFEELSRELEQGKIRELTELFIKRAKAYEEAYSADALAPGSDAYIVRRRIAQERILSEAMKDVYIKYLLPAIKAAKNSHETGAINNLRVDGKPLPRYVIEIDTDVPLVPGAEKLVDSQSKITWRNELNIILEPYSARWPFITVELIAQRMQVCAGSAGTMDNDKFPGFKAIRPDFDTETLRRSTGKLYIQDATANPLNSEKDMLGICLSR